MNTTSFSRRVDSSSSSRQKRASGSTSVPHTFVPFGRYAGVGSQKIKCSDPGVRLHVGSTSTLYLNKGTLLGKEITYISQVWDAWDAKSTHTFYEQVVSYIHPETLRPLMGVCTPTVIGINTAAGRLSLMMELPHPVGWRQADPYIPDELKDKVVIAYRRIHSQGILHNDVKLENMLIGDDDEVVIVDFCKMVPDANPADLALETRAVKFVLDYDGAKEIEYERARGVESPRTGTIVQRSWLRRAAESLGFICGAGQFPRDYPPFSLQCLAKWDSEVVTEGTTHCPGWKGERFEVPQNMRSPPWPEVQDHTPPSSPPRQPIDFSSPFEQIGSHYQWTKPHPCLWSPSPESSSSATTPIDLSDYATGSERSFTAEAEPRGRDRPSTPLVIRKRVRTGDLTHPDGFSRRNKRPRRSKTSEPFIMYEGDPIPWATYSTEELCLPSPLPKPKGKEEEPPPLVMSPRESSPSEPDLPTLADLSPSPAKSIVRNKSLMASGHCRRVPTFAGPRRSSPSTPAATSPQRRQLISEKRCSVVVMDSDEEDSMWFMSKEALQDIKGYLRIKKATGGAMEMHSGADEESLRNSRLQVERVMHSSSARPSRKRKNTPEGNDEGARKSKRRRSWPEPVPYVSKPHTGSLCND